MEKRYSLFVLALMILLVAYFSFRILSSATPRTDDATGAAAYFSTTSQATVLAYIGIAPSKNFTYGGIDFGSLNTDSANNNATGNFNATFFTEYNIEVLSSTNTDVDFCIRSTRNLTDDTNPTLPQIPYPLYRFSSVAGINSPSQPTYPPAVTPINANGTFIKDATNVPPGQANYYRFYLDVPAGQVPGYYTNTVVFQVTRAAITNANCV